jgi:hypothetical protein
MFLNQCYQHDQWEKSLSRTHSQNRTLPPKFSGFPHLPGFGANILTLINRRGFPMTENTLNLSTLVFGEEGHTTTIAGEECATSYAAETGDKLYAVTTSHVGEETTTFALGEEQVTTESLGEEGPTSTDGENPSPADFKSGRHGGPFGAF